MKTIIDRDKFMKRKVWLRSEEEEGEGKDKKERKKDRGMK